MADHSDLGFQPSAQANAHADLGFTPDKPKPRTFWDDVADTAKEYWNRTGKPVVEASQYFNTDPEAHQKAVEAIHGFVEGVKNVPLQTQRALEATGREMVHGHPGQAATEAIGAIPVVGPQSQEIGSDLEAGDYRGAIAHTGAMITPLVAGPAMGAAGDIVEAAPQALRTTGRVIKGAAIEGGKALIKRPQEAAALAAAGQYIAGHEGAAVGAVLGAVPSAIRGGIEAYHNAPEASSMRPQASPPPEAPAATPAPEPAPAQQPAPTEAPATPAPAETPPPVPVDARGQPIPTLDELAQGISGGKKTSYSALNVQEKAWVDNMKAKLDRTAVQPPAAPSEAPPQAAPTQTASSSQPPAAPPVGPDYLMPQPADVAPAAGQPQGLPAPGAQMPAPVAQPEPPPTPAEVGAMPAQAVPELTRPTRTPGNKGAGMDAGKMTDTLLKWKFSPDEAGAMGRKSWEKLAFDSGVQAPSAAVQAQTVLNLKRALGNSSKSALDLVGDLKRSLENGKVNGKDPLGIR